MTKISYPELQRMLAAFEELATATESFRKFIESSIDEMEIGDSLDEYQIDCWRRPLQQVRALSDSLEEDIFEQIRELVDRSGIMEYAKRGGFLGGQSTNSGQTSVRNGDF